MFKSMYLRTCVGHAQQQVGAVMHAHRRRVD
jgi:hypothetical protein